MKIQSKDQLIQELNRAFKQTIDWVYDQPESHFNEELMQGKWTIAGHIYHLIKSTKGVSKGMTMPKIGLRTMFGKAKIKERSYQEILDLYTDTLAASNVYAPGAYEAEPGRIFERASLINRFEGERHDFVKALEKWKEEDLSTYVMPHPVMGKFTIREFAYFTILHTHHHLNILKKNYVKVDA